MDIKLAIEQYLSNLWGDPARTAQFSGDGNDVSISKWEAGQTDEGVTLYVTNGASRRVCDASRGRRVEFILGLLPEQDAVAKSLAMLAGSVGSGIDVDRGHTVTLSEEFWPGASFRAFMVIPPAEEVVGPLGLDDGTHVEFLAVTPLYDSEVKLKKAHSAEWLMVKFEEMNIPWWSPRRPSL